MWETFQHCLICLSIVVADKRNAVLFWNCNAIIVLTGRVGKAVHTTWSGLAVNTSLVYGCSISPYDSEQRREK